MLDARVEQAPRSNPPSYDAMPSTNVTEARQNFKSHWANSLEGEMAALKQKMAKMEAEKLRWIGRCSVGDNVGVYESLDEKEPAPPLLEVKKSVPAKPAPPAHPPAFDEKTLTMEGELKAKAFAKAREDVGDEEKRHQAGRSRG